MVSGKCREDEGSLCIRDVVVTDGRSFLCPDGVVEITDGIIRYCGPRSEWCPKEMPAYSGGGRLLLPGLTNMHHHLYSALATGMAPLGPTPNFPSILEQMWWPLDEALGEEGIYLSALTGVLDCLRHGVTTLVDHHASMSFVKGSLSIVANALEYGGLKGVLCFEASERHGWEAFLEHVEENLEFAASVLEDPGMCGVFGMHANFTLSDEGLRFIAREKPESLPIHVHCGEDRSDLEYCREKGYAGPVDRLLRNGLLVPGTLLAHCVHLDHAEYELLEKYRPLVVTNPESNANNRVGAMDRHVISRYVFGTDGMSCDMVQTLRSQYLLGQASGTAEDFGALQRAFFDHRYDALQMWFPGSGSLAPGSPGDLAILDYAPSTPITLENLMGHLLFGARCGRAWMTLVEGKVLYHEGKFPYLDEPEIRSEARKAAEFLRRRFYG